ncbi:MAG TPA: TonB-dependent receptor [Cyclobacteriaceae bacterium]|nr:TonB-dependent receptor [Cyclobacteriaceae bacterium]
MKKILLIVFVSILSLTAALAQEKTISGRVVAADDGSALPGVNVVVKGTTNGTVTDSNGEYRITAPASAEQLIFSFIGFQTQEVTVGSRNVIDLTMAADVQQLNEVIVVGYGTQIKQDLTGNIASVKGDDVKNIPVPNFTQALQGRAAGVFVESQSGRVGEGIKVRIRGAGSLTASNEPLYVIDGIPINTSNLNSAQNGTTSNNGSALASINSNDIESFEILKDASAAAIYGSRAANGVVLITTKRGKAGKTSINANVQYGFNSPTNADRGFLNAEEYVSYFKEAARNGAIYDYNRNGNPDGYATEQDAIDDYTSIMEGRFTRYSGHSDWRTLQTNTDWQKEAYQKNPMVKIVNLSASGGTDKTKFFISGEASHQDGILIANKFGRISTRVNVDQEVNKIFKIGMNMSMARTVTGRTTQDNDFGTPMQIVALAPITPIRDLNGQLYDRPVTTYYNPLINFENGHYKSTIFRNLGGFYGQLKLAEGFTFRSEVGYDVLTQNDDQFFGSRTQSRSTNGFGQSDWLRTFNYNTNNFFNYSKIIGSRNTIDATLGMSFQKAVTDQTSVLGQDFPSDDLQKLASAGEITGGTSFQQQYSFLSYFSRVNFKFADKYLLSLSGRVDGSSRFGADNRYGFFPAISAGWIISEESFIKESSTVSFLKIRASAGRVGNAEIPENQALGLWGSGKYANVSSINPIQLANQKLGWEQATQVDIGLDYGLFNNRVSGELDYYVKNTTDLLYNVPVPGVSGFTNRVNNVGSMQNKGFEIVINSVNVNSRSFKWTTGFNFSRNMNKVTNLDGDVTEIPGNDGRYLNSLVVGQPIGVFYGPKYAGVDPANGDALYYTEDGETTTTNYNDAGNFIVGNPNPKFIYGLNNTFTIGSFDVSVLLQGVYGNKIINGGGGFMSANGDWFDNQTRDQLDRWQKPGDITQVPQARWNWSGLIPNGVSASSRYVYDGSYLRVKTASLGYNFPAALITRWNLTNLRVYVTGQNLLTFTKYPGWDPEVNADYRTTTTPNTSQGGDFYSAPQIKSVIFGVNVSF